MTCLKTLTNDAPSVSIVIVGCNSLKHLSQCLLSVMKSSYPHFEIIYVDNGSTDESTAYFQTRAGKKGRTIQLDRNYGFTAASNIGAGSATGEYLVFLNVDTIVDSNWLEPLVTTLEKGPTVGAAQSLLLRMGTSQIDSMGGFITPYGTVLSSGYAENYRDSSGIVEVFYSKAAAMITRRSLWKSAGGFDPIFYLYYQETDYCWRLRAMGYRVLCVRDSKVWHEGGAVSGRQPGALKYYEARERPMLLLKNYRVKRLIRLFPITICLQIGNSARFLLRGDPASAANIMRGTISTLTHFRIIWKHRRDFSADKVSENEILKMLMAVPRIRTFL